MNAIEESLWMAKEQIFMQRWRPETNDTYDSINLCSMLASLGGFALAAAYDSPIGALFSMSLPLIALPLAIKGTENVTKSIQQQYKNVLSIQDLVLTTFADLT